MMKENSNRFKFTYNSLLLEDDLYLELELLEEESLVKEILTNNSLLNKYLF